MLLRRVITNSLHRHKPSQLLPRCPQRGLSVTLDTHPSTRHALRVTSNASLGFSDSVRRQYTSTDSNIVASKYDDIPIPEVGIPEFVWSRIQEWSHKTAVVCGISGRGYTYAELRDKCRRFAVTLQAAGYKPGDVVAAILPNTPDYPLIIMGTFEAGLVLTTVNPAYTPEEISKQLLDSNPRVVVSCPENYAQVVEATRLACQQGYKKPWLVVAQSAVSNQVPDGATSLEDMIGPDIDVSAFTPVKVDPNSIACIPYSSGTTGMPKGVCLSHKNLIANALEGNCSGLTRAATGDTQDIIPAFLPFFHIYGIGAIAISKLYSGVKLITLPRFEPEAFLNIITKHKVTLLFVVPPLLLFMAASPAVTSELLSHVRLVGSAAAPLGEKDVVRFLKKTPPTAEVLQGYGLTEMPVVMLGEPGSVKYSSVGQVLPNNQVKVIDPATGDSLGAGKVGEVCTRGPQMMLGYYKQADATAAMIDKDGWLHTGDLGYYDEDRDFFIVDRLKELIKVKGFQVAPAELEEILRSHPHVLDAAVIGIPDELSGEVPLAYVVANPAASLDTLVEDIQTFVSGKVAKFKQLKGGVRIVKSIPKSPAGKIMRRTLREEYNRTQS